MNYKKEIPLEAKNKNINKYIIIKIFKIIANKDGQRGQPQAMASPSKVFPKKL